jgi:hypothetical protein
MIFLAIFPGIVKVAQVNFALVALPGCLLARLSPCRGPVLKQKK